MKLNSFFGLALSAMIAPCVVANEGWLTNIDEALAQAKAENKLVVMDITGSDWCKPCIELRTKVFDSEEYIAYAQDKFVMLEIDLPNKKKIDEALLAANKEICARYRIGGYPTVLVLNPEGKVMGGFVGWGKESRPVQESFNQALEFHQLYTQSLAAADTVDGLERAKLLWKVYAQVEEDMRYYHEDLKQGAIANDPQDTLGIQAAYAAEKALRDLQQRLRSTLIHVGDDKKASLAVIEEYLGKDEVPDSMRVELLQIKVHLMLSLAQSNEDVDAAYQVWQHMKTFKVNQRPDADAQFELLFADRENLLRRNQLHQ